MEKMWSLGERWLIASRPTLLKGNWWWGGSTKKRKRKMSSSVKKAVKISNKKLLKI